MVTSGLRDSAKQAALYAQGRTAPGPIVTNAPPGHSAHEHGLAIDVALQLPAGLSWDTNDPAWPRLWAAVKASQGLHSGHDFPPVAPADDDHIQAVRWYAVRAQLIENGQW